MNKSNNPFIVDIFPCKSETISAKEFLAITEQSPDLIRRSQFVLPQPGKSGFGSFWVEYTRPRLKSLAHGY